MCWENVRRKLIAFHALAGNNIMAALVLLATLSGLVCFAVLAASNRQAEPSTERGLQASREIRREGKAKQPLVTLSLRGDVGMSGEMRGAVERAAKDMTRVSCGMAKVDVTWNYQHDEDLVRAALRGDSVLRTITVQDVADSLGPEDAADLLGMVRAANNPRWKPVWVFLVRERLEDDAQLTEWTALHEFGHAVGMDHVKVGVMESRAPFFFGLEEQLEWSVEDQNEFCRIYKCDPTAFFKCELR